MKPWWKPESLEPWREQLHFDGDADLAQRLRDVWKVIVKRPQKEASK